MWGKKDFASKIDIRFPAGKGNVRKCRYVWWKVDGEFQKLNYISARKQIYTAVCEDSGEDRSLQPSRCTPQQREEPDVD